MIKIGDKVYFNGYEYEVVCMDKSHYGLAHIDSKDYIVAGLPVYMVPKTVTLEPIASKVFELGDKVHSLLKDKGGQTMTGTVVGYELENRVVVKSDRGCDRVRYSYRPTEIKKYDPSKTVTIAIPVADIIELSNGQLKFNISDNNSELAKLAKALKISLGVR